MMEHEKAVNLLKSIMEWMKKKYFLESKPFLLALIKEYGEKAQSEETASFNYAVCLKTYYELYPDEGTIEIIGKK